MRPLPTLALALLALALPSSAAADADVAVCHQAGPGQHALRVDAHAAPAHLGHGDHLVAEEVCDDGVDNDCDGLVDVDCCPCFTLADLVTWFDAGDQCVDFDLGTPEQAFEATYLASYEGEGLAAGVGDYPFYPAPFCSVIDLTNTGLIEFGISEEAYAACAALVLTAADEIGIVCSDVPVEE